MELPKLTNPTYTVNGKPRLLVDGITFTVGDVVTFDTTKKKGDLLPVNVWGDKVKTRAVAWLGQPWTVTAADGVCNRLLVQQRRAGGTIAQTHVTISVVAKPAAQPPKPTTPPDTDGDPVPPTPGSDTGVPAAAKLTGFMQVGLVDLAKVSYSVIKPLVDPLNLYSTRVWYSTNNFVIGKRDVDVAKGLEYERAGIKVVWCMAQSGLTPSAVANAVQWTLWAVGDLIDAYDANPVTQGKTVRIEWGNEPDLKKDGVYEYWRAGPDHFAATFCKVAYALKAKFGSRIQLIVGGFSWDVGTLSRFAAGFQSVGADALAYHGYPRELSQMNAYKTFANLAHGLDLLAIVTEGSPGYGKAVKAGTKTVDDWARDFPTYLIGLEAAGIDECQIFNASDINTTNSKGALFDSKWRPTATYEAVLSAVK